LLVPVETWPSESPWVTAS